MFKNPWFNLKDPDSSCFFARKTQIRQDIYRSYIKATSNSSRYLREMDHSFRLIFESASSVSQPSLAMKQEIGLKLYSSFNSKTSSYVRYIGYYFREMFESASVTTCEYDVQLQSISFPSRFNF